MLLVFDKHSAVYCIWCELLMVLTTLGGGGCTEHDQSFICCLVGPLFVFFNHSTGQPIKVPFISFQWLILQCGDLIAYMLWWYPKCLTIYSFFSVFFLFFDRIKGLYCWNGSSMAAPCQLASKAGWFYICWTENRLVERGLFNVMKISIEVKGNLWSQEVEKLDGKPISSLAESNAYWWSVILCRDQFRIITQ